MQVNIRRQVMPLVLMIFFLVLPILSSRQPLPACKGPNQSLTTRIPILFDQTKSYQLDDLYTRYNLNFSSPDLPKQAYLQPKIQQINSTAYHIDGLQHYHIDLQDPLIITLVLLSKQNGKIFISWGQTEQTYLAPQLNRKIMIEQSVDCYDAVWLQEQNRILVDCVEKQTFQSLSQTNYYYYIDVINEKVIGRVKNEVQYFQGKIKRILGIIRKDKVNFLVRAIIAKQVDTKSQQNTYVQLVSLENLLQPLTAYVFDRSTLHIDRFSITDIKFSQNSIYILDYFNGLVQLEINDKNVLQVVRTYKIARGYYNLGVYQNRQRSKQLLAFADRNKIIQVEWSDQLKPKLLNKYIVPENSDCSAYCLIYQLRTIIKYKRFNLYPQQEMSDIQSRFTCTFSFYQFLQPLIKYVSYNKLYTRRFQRKQDLKQIPIKYFSNFYAIVNSQNNFLFYYYSVQRKLKVNNSQMQLILYEVQLQIKVIQPIIQLLQYLKVCSH